MRTRAFLLALALPLVLATACGGDTTGTASDPTPTETSTGPSESPPPSASPSPAQPKSPQCSDIWVAGNTLPGRYEGCYEGQKRVRPDGRYCEFGKPLYTYDERFYAVTRGRIAEAKQPFVDDPGYQDALGKCSA